MTIQDEKIVLNERRNVVLTRLTQDVGGEFGKIDKRPSVLILPGGAYNVCSDREAEVVAYPYLHAGFHAFVLRYSVAEHKTWPNPLNDYEQAMKLIRSKENEWHVLTDKIAVIGFSAGGHLAACAATISENRPNAVILGYAAVEQDIADACQPGVNIPAPVKYVDGDTCPCFLFAARDDRVVPIKNTLNFQSKLAENGIQFESHVYAYGGHGFSTGAPCVIGTGICGRIPEWVEDSIGWLGDVFGLLTASGMGEPSCAAKMDGNKEKMLNVDCTLNYLAGQEISHNVLAEVFKTVDTVVEQRFGGNPGAKSVINEMRLRDILISLGYSGESIAKLNGALRQYQNVKQ